MEKVKDTGKIHIRDLTRCGAEELFPADKGEEFCRRFHFNKEDLAHILGIREALLPILDPWIFYIVKEQTIFFGITLGKGPDELIRLYLDHDSISDAYLVECVGCYLLERLYLLLPPLVHTATGLWPGALDFTDRAEELKRLEKLLLATECTIRVMEGGELEPGESVFCSAPLLDEKQECFGHICETCPRKADCPIGESMIN